MNISTIVLSIIAIMFICGGGGNGLCDRRPPTCEDCATVVKQASTVKRMTCDRLFAGTTGLSWEGGGHVAREGEEGTMGGGGL